MPAAGVCGACRRLWGHVPEDPPRVLFGPDSLESATIKAGQNGFRLASYEAILGRLSIHQGRVLLTSPWQAAKRNHPTIDIINFRSIDNPAFPKEEYYRVKKSMPPWRFSMLYDGLFSRPAGLIYGSFDETRHKIPRIAIPPRIAALPGRGLRRRQHGGHLLRPGARCLPQADGPAVRLSRVPGGRPLGGGTRRLFTCSTPFAMLFLICTWTNPRAAFRAAPWRGGGCRIFERGGA